MVKKNNPQLSVNQLAQYLVASPTRQLSIIKENKRPSPFRVAYYSDASSAIRRFFEGNLDDESILLAKAEELRHQAEEETSDWLRSKHLTQAEALDVFCEGYVDLQLNEVSIQVPPTDCGKLSLGGVSISVRPELYLEGEGKKGPFAGAVKLYFSKSEPLSDKSAGYLAALVHRCVSDEQEHEPSRDHCMVYDIFSGEIFVAPKSVKKRFKDVESSMTMVAAIWDQL